MVFPKSALAPYVVTCQSVGPVSKFVQAVVPEKLVDCSGILNDTRGWILLTLMTPWRLH